MSKKAKKRKHRKLSTSSSSSEDNKKASTNSNETAKGKHVSNNDDKEQKNKELSSSKEEAQKRRQIKKPVYRLEKTKSTRGQSPIFKEEESKNKARHSGPHKTEASLKMNKSESSSSKDRQAASSSRDKIARDIFLPRSVSVGQKKDHHPPKTKRSRELSPRVDSHKTKETKKPSSVCKDLPKQRKEMKEKLKKLHQEQRSSRSKKRHKSPVVSPSKVTNAATIPIKTKTSAAPLQRRETQNKECVKVQPQPPSKTSSKTAAPAKSALDKKTLPMKSDHKSCVTKSSSTVEPPLRQTNTPAAVSCTETPTASTSSMKTTEHLPGEQRKWIAVPPLPPSAFVGFRIPKKKDILSAKENKQTLPVKTGHSDSTTPVPQSSSSTTASSDLNVQKQDPCSSFVTNVSPALCENPSLGQDQIVVVEQLHQARSEKLLEVNVMQSYGELTCMEIDPPEDGAADTQSKELPQQDVIIVLDTNILISHLDYVKTIVSRGLEVICPVVLVPWVVLQELDSLKKGRVLPGSVAHSAIPAISFIYNCLKGRERRLWGQSMQQAAESSNALNAENNDDRVLQCCLQYQLLYPECAVVLCTNDKNLCSKALLSGVTAFSKIDLESEVARSSQGAPFLQNLQATVSPAARRSLSTPTPGKVQVQTEAQSQETTSLSVEEENNRRQIVDASRRNSRHLSSVVCQFESVLQEALSDVLEAEMKAAFQDLWLEIVYKKPPWSLSDVLQSLKKHWIAVFGHVVPRSKFQNVLDLIEFFSSGKGVDQDSTLAALHEAKDLLKHFMKSSSRVPGAISIVDSCINTLQPQGETSGTDVVMKEAEEDKQTSHAEVWALFTNVWDHVFQTSLEVFKAVDFDPKAAPGVRGARGPPPPRDALACLHTLLRTVSQLLQAFSSFLTSLALPEAHSLLNVMKSTEVVKVDNVTATDLLNCFSQEDYRERLRTGGGQLMEVQAALNNCVEFISPQVPFTAHL